MDSAEADRRLQEELAVRRGRSSANKTTRRGLPQQGKWPLGVQLLVGAVTIALMAWVAYKSFAP